MFCPRGNTYDTLLTQHWNPTPSSISHALNNTGYFLANLFPAWFNSPKPVPDVSVSSVNLITRGRVLTVTCNLQLWAHTIRVNACLICCISVAVTQGLSAPLTEYTIHIDLLNAASLLCCITTASEHRPEECTTRGRGRAKTWRRREVWKRRGREEMNKWRRGKTERSQTFIFLSVRKTYGNSCLF